MNDDLEAVRAGLAAQYTIDREIGRGGMASVFLARDNRYDRLVAVKVSGECDTPDGLGRLWYTMSFVDGESLRDRLRRERQLPVETAVSIAREVADALDYAHRRGVIHRDVKPEASSASSIGRPLRCRAVSFGAPSSPPSWFADRDACWLMSRFVASHQRMPRT